MPMPEELKRRRKISLSAIPEKLARLYTPKQAVSFSNDPDKKLLQQGVLLEALRRGKFDPSGDNAEAAYQSLAKAVLEGNNPVWRELAAEEGPRTMILLADLMDDDPAVSEKARLAYSELRRVRIGSSGKSSLPKSEALAQTWDDLLFAPRTHYDSRRVANNEDLERAHAEADAVTIDVPEGLDEKTVKCAVISEFLKKDTLLRVGHMVNEVNSDYISTTSVMISRRQGLPITEADYLLDGVTFTFDNTLMGDDLRMNGYLPRLLAPELRQHAKGIVDRYPEDPGALAALLKEGFEAALNEANASAKEREIGTSYFPARMAIELCDVLDTPAFRSLAPLSDREKQMVRFLRNDIALMSRRQTLEDEIRAYVLDHAISEDSTAPSDDLQFRTMYQEYQALNLLRERKIKDFDAIKTLSGLSGVSLDRRDLTRLERNIAEEPRLYVEHLKTVAADGLNDPALTKSMESWGSLLKALPDHEKAMGPVVKAESSLLLPEQDRIALPRSVRNCIGELEQYLLYPSDPKKVVNGAFRDNKTREEDRTARQILAHLKSLPCMNGSFVRPDSSKAEMERLAQAYSDAVQLISGKELRYNTVETDPEGEINYSFGSVHLDSVKSILQKEVEQLRGYSALLSGESAFQAATFAQYSNNAGMRSEAARTGAPAPEQFVCGRPTRQTFRDEIRDLFTANPTLAERYPELDRIRIEAFAEQSSAVLHLDELRESLEKKMLDDDSEQLMRDYDAIMKISSAVESYLDTPELAENSGAYQKMYDNAETRLNHLAQDLEALPKGSEHYKLALRARDAMEQVRDAVAAECFGDSKNGIASLRGSDALAAVSAYQVVSGSESKDVAAALNKKGAEKFVKSVNTSSAAKANKKALTAGGLAEMLRSDLGFSAFMKAPEKKAAKAAKAPAVSRESVAGK